jgi:hypothetical protein
MMVTLCAACNGSGSTGAVAGEDDSLSPSVATKKDADLPVYQDITLPAGTRLRLDLATAVSSDASRVEDTVKATLREAVIIDGQTILPAGTELTGTVIEAVRSGRVKGRARVAYRFTSLRYDSERHDIRTATISHEAKATKREDAKKIGIGAGVGAAVGAILGGGSGAAKGAAIGGAGGTGVVLATRGEEVRLGPGANVNTRLTEPLTLQVKAPARASL